MSALIFITFFRSICLFLQDIILYIYEKFLNPKPINYWLSTTSPASSSLTIPTKLSRHPYHRSYLSSSSLLSSSTTEIPYPTDEYERGRLLEQIRIRKKAKLRKRMSK